MGRRGQASDRHSETVILYLFKQACHLGLGGYGVGSPRGGSLGCGQFCSQLPSEYQPSLASWSQELRRRARELPSGQSPQFSPSALPFGHMPGCFPKRNKPEPEERRTGGRISCVCGKETHGPNSLQKYQTWKKHVEGERIRFPQSCVQSLPPSTSRP